MATKKVLIIPYQHLFSHIFARQVENQTYETESLRKNKSKKRTILYSMRNYMNNIKKSKKTKENQHTNISRYLLK